MNLSYTAIKASLSKRRTRWIVGGALLLGTATPSFALFGLGDIVFDPTSYASLVSQLSTLTSMYTTAKSQYETTVASLKNFSIKTAWKTDLNQLKNVNVGNTFGETNGLTVALNSDSTTNANSAWKNGNVSLSTDTTSLLSGQSVGSSTQLSQLAMIEASDAASPDCTTQLVPTARREQQAAPPSRTCSSSNSTAATTRIARCSNSTYSTLDRFSR